MRYAMGVFMPAEKKVRRKIPESEKLSIMANERGFRYAYPVTVGRNNYIVLSNERTGTSFHDIRTAVKEDRLLKKDGQSLEERDREQLRANMLGSGVPKVAEKVVEEVKPEEVKTEDYSFSFKDKFDEYTQGRVEMELGKDGFEALEAHLNGNYEKVQVLAEKNKVMHSDFAWKTQVISECMETDNAGNYTLHGKGANTLEIMKESAYPEDKVYDPSKKTVNVIPLDVVGDTFTFFEKHLGPEMASYAYKYFNDPEGFLTSAHPVKRWGMQQISERLKKGEDGLYYLTDEDMKELDEILEKTPKDERVFDEVLLAAKKIPEEKVPGVIGPEEKEEYPETIEEKEERVTEVIGPEKEKPTMVAKKEEYPETIEEKEEETEVIGPSGEEPTRVAKKEEEIDITPAALGIEEKKVAGPLALTKESLAWIEETFGSEMYPSIKEAVDLYHQGKKDEIKYPVLKNLAKAINENAVFDEESHLHKIADTNKVLASHIEMQNRGEFLMANEVTAIPETKTVSMLVVGPEGTERNKLVLAFDAEFYDKNIADPKAPGKYKREAVLANLDNAKITIDGKEISVEEAKKIIGA